MASEKLSGDQILERVNVLMFLQCGQIEEVKHQLKAAGYEDKPGEIVGTLTFMKREIQEQAKEIADYKASKERMSEEDRQEFGPNGRPAPTVEALEKGPKPIADERIERFMRTLVAVKTVCGNAMVGSGRLKFDKGVKWMAGRVQQVIKENNIPQPPIEKGNKT